MKKMKLAVIGGGSVNWMRGLMKDVYLIDGVDGGEIRLVDPNVSHVTSVKNMLLKFNELTGKDYQVSIVENRLDALRGCDFVLTTFSPGAMDAFYNDLEIPIKYGVRLPVSMTCGISGISASLRTVPVAYEIVEEMEKVCPGATLINVTNPMTTVTKALNLPARTVHVYGLCHGAYDLRGILDQIFGLKKPEGMLDREYMHDWLPKQGFDFTIAGLNHFIFLTKATWNGRDVLEDIRRYAREHDGFGDKKDEPMLDLRGQQLFIDYYDDPQLARHLLGVVTELCLRVGKRLYAVSPVISGGVTSIIKQAAPRVYLTGNCSVTMVSNETYCEYLLDYDTLLAEAFPDFGIHHCGNNMERVIEGYLRVPNLRFLEIGAGSDLEKVAGALRAHGREDIVSCIRYSPMKLRTVGVDVIREDTERAIRVFGSDANLCFSCVGIDAETTDEQVKAYLSVFR